MPLSEVRAKLTAIFPPFEEWLDEYSLFYNETDEGTRIFTRCGLFLELTCFLRERKDLWSPSLMTQFSQFCEQALESEDYNLKSSEDGLHNAVAAGFFESVHSDEDLGNALRPFLGTSSLHILDNL